MGFSGSDGSAGFWGSAGLPERIAMKALGHSSKAIHHAYAKNAVVEVPSLEGYAKG